MSRKNPVLFTEFLLGDGQIQRRYEIRDRDHTGDILDHWRPLVEKLLERPGERQYHGMVGLPYWDASLSLSPELAHPELESGQWLVFYASPESTEPYYVGALIPRQAPPDHLIYAEFISAISGGREMLLAKRMLQESPCLIGTYWPVGLIGIDDVAGAVQGTGECAAILGRLVLEGLKGI